MRLQAEILFYFSFENEKDWEPKTGLFLRWEKDGRKRTRPKKYLKRKTDNHQLVTDN